MSKHPSAKYYQDKERVPKKACERYHSFQPYPHCPKCPKFS